MTIAPRTALRQLIDDQANDVGCWFLAKTAPEAYLQQALRQLHAAGERVLAAEELQDWQPIIRDMCRASALADEMIGPGDYAIRMINLAIITRAFLRTYAESLARAEAQEAQR